MPDEWIIHRPLGVGRVLQRSGRSVTAEFSEGTETVDGKYFKVPAGSFRVLAHLDLKALIDLTDEDPSAVALAILEDQDDVPVERLVALLCEVGVPTAAAERWLERLREIDPATAPFVIAVAGDEPSGREVLSRPPTTVPVDVDELLAAIAAGQGSDEDHKHARTLIAAEHEEDRLSPSQVATAGLLGVLPAKPAAMRDLDLDAIDGDLLRAIVGKTDDLGFLERVFFEARRQSEAKAALRVLAKHDRPTSQTARNRLSTPLASLAASSPDSVDEAQVERLLQRLALLPRQLVDDLAEPIANLAAAARRGPAGQSMDRVASAADGLLALVPDRAPELVGVAVRHEQGVAIGSSLPLKRGGFRLAYMAALVAEPVGSRLGHDGVWSGVTVEDLVALAESGDPSWRTLLGADAARRAIGRIVTAAVQKGSARTLALLLTVDGLFELLDEEDVRSVLDRLLLTDSRFQLMQRLLSVEPVDQQRRIDEQARAELMIRHEEEIAVLRRRIEDLDDELVGQRHRLEFLQSELTRHTGDISEASTAQTRQAWIEAAQVAAEILSELARIGSEGDAAHERVEGIARSHGIESRGRPGEVVRFDPALHRMLVGDPTEHVLIVESPIVTRKFGDVTTLRYGLVRDDEGSRR